MKERPIIFSSEMVKAILDDRKTQTRRPITWPRIFWVANTALGVKPYWRFEYAAGSGPFIPNEWVDYCRYGQPGDRLWVRETWQLEMNSGFYDIRYKADGYLWDCGSLYQKLKTRKCWIWRPSIHMPRWASRITLEIVDVRVERLGEITTEDMIQEGFSTSGYVYRDEEDFKDFGYQEYRDAFAYEIWDSLYTKNPEYQWQANPWCWCISFRRIK